MRTVQNHSRPLFVDCSLFIDYFLCLQLHKNPENMRIIEQTFNPVDFLPNLNSQNLSETSVSTTISKRSKLDLKNDHGKTDNNIKQTKCIKPMQPVVSKSVRKRMLHHDANDMLLDVPLTKKSSQSSNLKLGKSRVWFK